MKKQAVEVSVGLFVILGLACVAYLTVKLGQMDLLGDDYYHVTARFRSIGGLKEGARVDMAGVQIGQVETITLDTKDYLAVVAIKVHQSVPLTEDVIASVKTSGLIGDKYIQIAPGGSDVMLEDGGEIFETESAVDLEEMVSKYAFGDV